MAEGPNSNAKAFSGAAVVIDVLLGIAIGKSIPKSVAHMSILTEHKGLQVETLGMVPEESMKTRLRLEGRIRLLRAIAIEPDGQIAKVGPTKCRKAGARSRPGNWHHYRDRS